MTRKIFFLSVILSLLIVKNGISQNPFYYYYPDSHTNATLIKALRTSDGNFLLFGSGDSIVINKFDSTGTNTWSQIYWMPGHYLLGGNIIEMHNGDLVISGATNVQSSIDSYFILRLDSNGNILFAKMDRDSSQVQSYWGDVSIAGSTPDNGIVFSGVILPHTIFSYLPFICKADSLGNAQWARVFQPDTNTYIEHIRSSQSGNGEIILTGFYSYTNIINSRSYFFIASFDSLGNLQWSKRSQQSSRSSSVIADKAIEKDGDYYVLTTQDTPTQNTNVPHIYKVSVTDGHLVWHTRYDFYTGYNDVNNMMRSDNNLLTITGRDDSLPSNAFMLIETDTMGDIVKSQLYDYPYPFYTVFLNHIFLQNGTDLMYGFGGDLSGGGLLISVLDTEYRMQCQSAGISLPSPEYYIDSLISSGNSYTDTFSLIDITNYMQVSSFILQEVDFCNYTSASAIDQEELFSVYPNPATTRFEVSLSEYKVGEIEIYNSVGEKIYTTQFSEQLTIDCRHFNKGIYLVRLSDSEKQLTQKLVVE